MATVTTLAGGTVPGINAGENWGFDSSATVLIATSNAFSWLSPDGHKVTLLGNFTYGNGLTEPPTSGTIDEARFDHANNGSDDMTIDYGVSPITLDDSNFGTNSFSFLDNYLGQADTMVLGHTSITGTAFAADGDTSTYYNDTILITGSGDFSGDDFNVSGTIAETGIDDITINSSLSVDVAGDSWGASPNNSTPSTLNFAGDTITDISAPGGATHLLVGDVFRLTGTVSNYTFNFGDDVLTDGAGDNRLYGDINFTSSTVSNIVINGGGDTIDGGDGDDFLYGDIGNLAGGVVFTGGDDFIDGGDGDDTIYGDYGSILGSSVIIVAGGVDTIDGEAGNDTIYGQEGDDILNGGADDDIIGGGAGNDTIDGDSGIDTVTYADTANAVNVTLGGTGSGTATGEGTDTIIQIENVIGSDFADTITGDQFDNVINGGLGNDIMNGSTGSDTLDYANAVSAITIDLSLTTAQATGGAGTDTISNFENVIGSDFADTIFGSDQTNEIYGGQGADTLLLRSATSGFPATGDNNQIFGEDGNDILGFSLTGVGQSEVGNGHLFDGGDDFDTFVFETYEGNYFVDLDDGFFYSIASNGDLSQRAELANIEAISAGNGDDVLLGTSGANTINGNNGDDTIGGGVNTSGTDILDGGVGIDTITFKGFSTAISVTFDLSITSTQNTGGFGFVKASNFENIEGSNGADMLTGNSVDNVIDGGNGDDTINGGDGNDTIIGGAGTNSLSGGDGFDRFIGGAGFDFFDGGANLDVVTYESASAAIVFDQQNAALNTGDATGDTFFSIDKFFATDFDDIMRGNAIASEFSGGAGNDVLFMRGGNDQAFGNDGEDELYGQGGNDRLFGGADNDLLNGGQGSDVLNGGDGIDTASYISSLVGLTVDLQTAVNTGEANGDSYISIENLEGTLHNDILRGNGGDNLIKGSGGNDTIFGRGGADTLQGGIGADHLYGQGGVDILEGGNDNDRLDGGADGDILNGGTGYDYADYGSATSGVGASLNNVSVVNSGDAAGDIYISIEGLIGSQFSDNLEGNGGNNTLSGLNGVDTIYGQGGNDTIFGGGDNDVLIGGDGNDTLTGGTGADQFFFEGTGTEGLDIITDFISGSDAIALGSGGIFSIVGAAVDANEFKDLANGAQDADDIFIYNSATGALFFDADGLGGAAAIRIANIGAGTALDFSDFIVI